MSKSQPETVKLSSSKRHEVIQRLNKGIHPDCLYYNGETILTHLSRDCGDAELPLYLLTKGADPYIVNSKGEAAIGFAMQNKYQFLIEIFSLDPVNRMLQAQIYINSPDKDNCEQAPSSAIAKPQAAPSIAHSFSSGQVGNKR